jgi:hypothetical protein
MEALIRDLLAQLGATLVSPPPHNPCPGLSMLGVIDNPPRTRSATHLSAGCHVWHAEDGWAPLDRHELERWLVDAGEGQHWLISERRLSIASELPQRDGIEYDLWSPDRLSQWLGEAVLNGDLSATVPSSLPRSIQEPMAQGEIEAEEVERSITQRPDSLPGEGPIALHPVVSVEEVLQGIDLDEAESRPVLISARIWEVTGILRGPEDAAERQWWNILDDPICASIDHLGRVNTMEFIPSLERVEPQNWPSQESVMQALPGLCEERRHYTVHEAAGSSQVRGSLLHWWHLDPSSAEVTARLALIPAWQVRIPSRGWVLVHGLTGQILPMPQ